MERSARDTANEPDLLRERYEDSRTQRQQFDRLFMVPGMGHCRGGTGTDVFDKIGVLDRWVESGKAPTSIVASRVTNGAVDRTRPLCPYPQVAVYDKRGDSNRVESFSCRTR